MTTLRSYSFCEPSTAGPCAPWCIRKLTAAGQKFGGGVDTPSLCGRVKPCGEGGADGWDVRCDVNIEQHRQMICKRCLAKVMELEQEPACNCTGAMHGHADQCALVLHRHGGKR